MRLFFIAIILVVCSVTFAEINVVGETESRFGGGDNEKQDLDKANQYLEGLLKNKIKQTFTIHLFVNTQKHNDKNTASVRARIVNRGSTIYILGAGYHYQNDYRVLKSYLAKARLDSIKLTLEQLAGKILALKQAAKLHRHDSFKFVTLENMLHVFGKKKEDAHLKYYILEKLLESDLELQDWLKLSNINVTVITKANDKHYFANLSCTLVENGQLVMLDTHTLRKYRRDESMLETRYRALLHIADGLNSQMLYHLK